MSNITLDSIRDAAEAKYGSTVIELGDGKSAKLLNPLRLAKEKRSELSHITDGLKGEDVDQAEIFEQALTLVAETPAQGKALVKAIGGDLAVLLSTFETYTAGAQVGEASASQS